MDRLNELRASVHAALQRMKDAHTALQSPADDADLEALERTFTDAETEHRTAVEALQREERMAEALRNAPVQPGAPTPKVEIKHEPRTYDRGQGNSYFLDLARKQIQGDPGAGQRLAKHVEETRGEVAKREEARAAVTDRALQEMLEDLPEPIARRVHQELQLRVESRDLSRTDGAGGEFVPPLWLLDEYAEMARGGRVVSAAVRNVPLPGGTDSINVPRITTGTATAAQTADNAAVQETDMVTATVTAPVRTIAGQQDVALQLLEQSPIAFDEIVFADLIADYDFRVEDQVVNGSGAAGQVKGLRNITGFNAITYTDASPTLAELFSKIADGLSQARTARKRAINAGFIAPRRFYWASAAADSTGRPLVSPQMNGPTNALGVRDQLAEEDPVLNMLVPHRMTDAIPTNVGAGTNEDVAILTRTMDHILFEGALRARVLPEILSGNLGVRLQVYAYCAFTAERFPAATSIVSGTGLVTPTF